MTTKNAKLKRQIAKENAISFFDELVAELADTGTLKIRTWTSRERSLYKRVLKFLKEA